MYIYGAPVIRQSLDCIIMIDKVEKFWQSEFNACQPIAYTLKDLFQNRWVRFHALPESKRYPENDSEYIEVLFRHNTIISELSKENQTLYVVASEYSYKKEHSELESRLNSLLPNNFYWNTVPMHEPNEEEEFKSYWHQYVSEVKWKVGVFDRIFGLVAGDEITNIMIININSRWVFHPYDGGCDVVLVNESTRNTLKDNHKEWLSTHPEGL